MKCIRRLSGLSIFLAVVFAFTACGGRGGGSSAPAIPGGSGALDMNRMTVKAKSPASIPAPPMAKTAARSVAADMTSRTPQSTIMPSNFQQLPGAATQAAGSPDGSLWVLSTQGNGSDYYIYHYVNGTWTNIPGAASRIAVGPDGTPWVINSSGGIYYYNGSSFVGINGGASDITVAADGSVYVLSSQGNQFGRAIFHYVNGTWTELNGAGVRIAASLDPGTYSGGIVPGGFYIVNAIQSIYYYNPTTMTYVSVPGGVVQLAPTTHGGLFGLGYAGGPYGYPIYYEDVSTGTWTEQNGAASVITVGGSYVYVINANGAIYKSPLVSNVGVGTALSGPALGPAPYDAWGPTSNANALQYPVQSGYNGYGYTVAIVGDSTIHQSDISTYQAYFQTPQTGRSITVEPVDGGTTGLNAESTLDVETVAGLAPGANISLYEMPSLTIAHEIDAYNAIISAGQASIVSSSFGGCESSSYPTSTGESSVFAAGIAAGVAFIASSGDTGNTCPGLVSGTIEGVMYPASDPSVIGVGGTETYPPATLTSTVAWNDTYSSTGQEASGGGVSVTFGLPSYQSGLAGEASTTNRNVPDIAMPGIYTAVYYEGAWSAYGGTSWSAPQFAAMLAEVYQYCGTSFKNAETIPYYVAQHDGYNAFIDVTSGNNQYGSAIPFYTAGTGYDNVTGIGVPLGMPFAETICPNHVPAATLRSGSTMSLAQARPAQAYSVDVTPRVAGLTDLGHKAATDQVGVQFVLRPGSSTAAADEQAVIAALTAAHLSVSRTFTNHLVVDASGSTQAVEAFLSTTIDSIGQGTAVEYMPVKPVVVPASLAPYITGVSLDSIVTASDPRAGQIKRR